MEQSEKNKISCLKFILENKVSKEGKTEFQLAEDLFKWTTSEGYDIKEKNSAEHYEILPEGYSAEDLEKPAVKAVLGFINRDPERMKKLANVENNSKNFQNNPDDQ